MKRGIGEGSTIVRKLTIFAWCLKDWIPSVESEVQNLSDMIGKAQSPMLIALSSESKTTSFRASEDDLNQWADSYERKQSQYERALHPWEVPKPATLGPD